MSHPDHKIVFTLTYSDEDHVIHTYAGEYRNLKDLIEDKFFPDDFGQCGGMGRCATCMIELYGSGTYNVPLKRNEQTTLARFARNGSVRLSCQMEIDDDLANQYVKIVGNI